MTIVINGTTGISGVDGSAGTPAVQGTDTNTGVFYPAADTVGVSTGGSERMRVDSSGNVGIGTSSPSVKLDIANGTIQVTSGYGVFSGAGGANASGFNFGTNLVQAYTSNAERMRIDSSGNVLIGTTTAQTGAVLAVTGGIQGTIKSGTAVASTSGTSIDFTGIPSWVKRVTVMLVGVSTNGSSDPILRLGTSGGIESTSYAGSVTTNYGTNAGSYTQSISTGFDAVYDWGSTEAIAGQYIVSLVGSNVWVCTWAFGHTNGNRTQFGGGTKTLSGTLDRIRFTTANGTDTFDAGTINIMYEG